MTLTIALLGIAGLLTVLDWRKGLLMCIFIGVAQDPLRKLAPGQPTYYVVLVGLLFGLTWLRAAGARVPLGLRSIYGWKRQPKVPFPVFTLLVPAQAYVGQFLATFKEFPQRQKADSFNLDSVLRKMPEGGGSK